MNFKTRKILFQIAITGCFIALPVIFAPVHESFSSFLKNPHGLKDLLINILLVLFFYLNTYYIIPAFYFRKKYVQYTIIQVLCLTAIVFVPMYLWDLQSGSPDGKRDSLTHTLFHIFNQTLILFLAVHFLSLFLRINRRWRISEKEKMKAELSFLKARIHPHFLFNSLNSIYALAVEKSDEAPLAVVKLAGMMRYVTTDTHEDVVPLYKELDYIKNYIELQKLRFGSTARIELKIEGNVPPLNIAPLILIPFIENAIKFGVNPEEDSHIVIDINLKGRTIHLHTENNNVFQNEDFLKGAGIGVDNTLTRLGIVYPGKYTFDVKENNGKYIVDLEIDMS